MKPRAKKAIKKATHIVHWPTGPVYACKEHANALVFLSNYLGSHTVASICHEDKECTNCVTAAREQ